VSTSAAVARVILDTPLPQLDHILEYSIPEALRQIDLTGYLVSVPLRSGKRFAQAYVIDVSDTVSFSGKLSAIEAIISSRPLLLSSTYSLALKISQRQAGVVSDVLRLVIPQRYVRAEKSFVPSTLPELPLPDSDHVQNPFIPQRSAALYPTYFSANGIHQWVSDFTAMAINNIQHGKSTVLCVPDFRNISALSDSIEKAGYGDVLVRLDSKISGQERYVNYLRSIQSSPVIILGNRSSVLSPAHNLGSILVWDESDQNMTEQHAPYFSVRDAALIRQQVEDCSLVFASFSRSVFIQRLVSLGWLDEIPFSYNDGPRIIASDSMVEADAFTERMPSIALGTAKNALKEGPVLIQVASPGYTGALACSACREKALCSDCSGFLYLPHKSSQPQCRQCGRLDTSWSCIHCHSKTLRYLHSGTEKTAEDLGKMFPGIQIIISDSKHIVTEISDKPAVVIATPGAEPQAPLGYSAVVVLDGQRHLLRDIPDAEDHYLRQCSQAISLCRQQGEAVVVGSGKTFGDIIAFHRYREWAQTEFSERAALGLPPSVRSASLEGSTKTINQALERISSQITKSFGPFTTTQGRSRAMIFFEYRHGDEVSKSLKALIITSSSKPRQSPKASQPRMVDLRVKMDNQWLA
jgi:primosomal protein N' (replication factor Y)